MAKVPLNIRPIPSEYKKLAIYQKIQIISGKPGVGGG